MFRRTPLLLAAGLALSATGPALAGDEASPTPPTRVVEQALGASYNKLGLQHLVGVRFTRPLTRSRAPLLADARASAGLTHTLTPSYARLSAWTELAPLSVLDFRAGVEPAVYFGSFGSLRSYGAYTSDFRHDSPETRTAETHPGTGVRAYLASSVKLKIDTIAVASTATIEWWRSSAAGPFFYEPARDTLLRAAGDRLLVVSTVLVRQVPQRAGGRLSYGVSHELLEVPDAPGNRSQKIGLVLARRLASKHLGLPSPSLGLRVSYYLEDPQRKGQVGATFGVSVERPR